MTYRESGAAGGVIACVWEHRPVADGVQLIVPDGCVDLIWLSGRELVVAGPDAGAREVGLPGGAASLGVRLRIGAAGAFLGRPADELLDTQVPAVDVWGGWARRLGDRLAAAPSRRLLVEAVRARAVRPDPLVTAAVAALDRPGRRIAAVAADLGVGERTLHRRTVAAVGYGPKTLDRVLRLRRLVERTRGPLAERAHAAGYAGQSHLSDEVRLLTGRTAVRFLEDRTPVAV